MEQRQFRPTTARYICAPAENDALNCPLIGVARTRDYCGNVLAKKCDRHHAYDGHMLHATDRSSV